MKGMFLLMFIFLISLVGAQVYTNVDVSAKVLDSDLKLNAGAKMNGSFEDIIQTNNRFGIKIDINHIKIGQKVNMSNGNNAEIRILPSTASATALARLQVNCNNCTIELKEVGSKGNVSMAYEIQGTKDSRFLGLFKAKMNVKAQVNAETGEVIGVNKPFWAFLASEGEVESN